MVSCCMVKDQGLEASSLKVLVIVSIDNNPKMFCISSPEVKKDIFT